MQLKTICLRASMALCVIFAVVEIQAQPGGGSGLGGGSNTGPPPPVGAPIDGAEVLLLLGTAGYAYTKLKAIDQTLPAI